MLCVCLGGYAKGAKRTGTPLRLSPFWMERAQQRCQLPGAHIDLICRALTCHLCSLTILFPPLTKMVTALRLGQPSITNILSLVVPNPTSLTLPANPSLSGASSLHDKEPHA